MGPHNIYFIYDTCPLRSLEAWLQESGKSMRWLTKALRTELSTNGQVSTIHAWHAYMHVRWLCGSNDSDDCDRRLNRMR